MFTEHGLKDFSYKGQPITSESYGILLDRIAQMEEPCIEITEELRMEILKRILSGRVPQPAPEPKPKPKKTAYVNPPRGREPSFLL